MSNDWNATTMFSKQMFPMTEKKCLAIGGHCWVDDTAYTLTSYPPSTTYNRHCKHCGKQQVGRSQDSIDWEDST